jgi:AmiR/NasT family two-component response regulator
MIKPMVRIHNIETNEIIDREMTDVEYERWQSETAAYQAKLQAEAEAVAAKAALLERLGITEEEAKLLLS